MLAVWVGSIAQRLEQGTHNPLVEGSNPSGPNHSLAEAAGRLFTQHYILPSHSRVVDKGREKIKKIEGHGRWKRVEYEYALLVAPCFVFADVLDFPTASPRECECHE